jgi:hypothetical protein
MTNDTRATLSGGISVKVAVYVGGLERQGEESDDAEDEREEIDHLAESRACLGRQGQVPS